MLEIQLTDKNFENEVLATEKLVVVDFWATWCGPCKMLAPVIEEIAKEYGEIIKVCKVNVDEQNELAIKYQISSIPTVVFFKNGEIKDTLIGFNSKIELEKIINSLK